MEELFPVIYATLSITEGVIDYYNYINLRYLVKPLTMVVLILYYKYKTQKVNSKFANLISYALVFSLLGDIALMFAYDDSKKSELWFIAGLLAFAVGHIFFIAGYNFNIQSSVRKVDPTTYAVLSIPYVAYGFGLIYYLYPNLGGMKPHVIFYGILLSTMGIMATVRYFHTSSTSFYYVLFGALLFISSDSMIALSKFAGFKSPCINSAIILTYFAAQYLIVMGVLNHIIQKTTPPVKKE